MTLDSSNSAYPITITTTGSSGTAGSSPVWIAAGTTTNAPYTISGGSSTITAASTWADASPVATCCKFCDKAIEIGLIIQSKEKSKTHVCVKCAKEYMGGEKIKELLDLIEALATTAELAKA